VVLMPDKRLQVSANWSEASSPIRYRLGSSDSWHQTTLQVADARHSKTRALAMVRKWVKSQGYLDNPSRRFPKGWIPAKAVKITRKKNGSTEVRIRR
jgi:hypothetical protein